MFFRRMCPSVHGIGLVRESTLRNGGFFSRISCWDKGKAELVSQEEVLLRAHALSDTLKEKLEPRQ